MTNPTLERAARALIDHWFENNDHGPMEPVKQPWEDLSPKQRAYAIGQARAVLMAVLPTLERYSLIWDLEPDSEGGLVYFWDLEAILNDGEGE